jgi:hypothetical protein
MRCADPPHESAVGRACIYLSPYCSRAIDKRIACLKRPRIWRPRCDLLLAGQQSASNRSTMTCLVSGDLRMKSGRLSGSRGSPGPARPRRMAPDGWLPHRHASRPTAIPRHPAGRSPAWSPQDQRARRAERLPPHSGASCVRDRTLRSPARGLRTASRARARERHAPVPGCGARFSAAGRASAWPDPRDRTRRRGRAGPDRPRPPGR